MDTRELGLRNSTFRLVLTGILAAILNVGKFALSWLPNVEIVTLLIVVYAITLPLGVSMGSTVIFCVIEGFLYGFNPWIIMYFIHWPALCIVFYFLSKITSKSWVHAIVALVMTVLFGVQSSILQVLFFANGGDFWSVFTAIYISGITFYITQCVCAVVTVLFMSKPLNKVLSKVLGTHQS